MDDLALLIDLHIGGIRQGPGSPEATDQALALAGLMGKQGLKVADIGCGTGTVSLQLAERLNADVTAVDFLPEFLAKLDEAAQTKGLKERIKTLAASMEDLPFEEGVFDAIWSEGAIYNMGFEAGIKAWRRFLKPGGVLAVSELSWLTAKRPDALDAHWNAAYPEVATASEKIAQLEANGYHLLGYFPLSDTCWRDHYYGPLQARFDAFLERQNHSEAAKAIVSAEEQEIRLYERYKAYVSYGFYVAERIED